MRNIFNSLIFKTFVIVLIISLIFFSGVFFILMNNSTQYLTNQSYENIVDRIELLNTCRKLTFSNVENIIYMLSKEELIYSEDKDDISSLLNDYREANQEIISHIMIADKSGIIAFDTPYILTAIDVDISKYWELSHSNKLILTPPYYSALTSLRTVSFIKLIDRDKLLIVEMETKKILNSMLGNVINKDEAVVVLNKSGDSVFMDYTSEVYQDLVVKDKMLDIHDDFRNILMEIDDVSGDIEYKGTSYVVFKDSWDYDWDIYFIISFNLYNEAKQNMTVSYLRIAGIAIAVLIVAVILISLGISWPMIELSRHMDTININTYKEERYSKRNDEIGYLWRSFNNLMLRLKNTMDEKISMEQEKRNMEYKVLQSQIKPHFLFNTLICISSLIKNDEKTNARKMIESLISLLRTSIDKTDAFITIEEELQSANDYVSLQKLRFGDIFDFEIYTDEKFDKIKIPKLLLQPIIENSIYHGIMEIKHRGKLKVELMDIADNLHIIIWDNGKGISEEKLEEIKNPEIQHSKEHSQKKGMVSIGLSNIESRIKLHYGNDYGLYVSSQPMVQTRVEIVIPYNE